MEVQQYGLGVPHLSPEDLTSISECPRAETGAKRSVPAAGVAPEMPPRACPFRHVDHHPKVSCSPTTSKLGRTSLHLDRIVLEAKNSRQERRSEFSRILQDIDALLGRAPLPVSQGIL